jgi:hypothetical protein
LFLLALLLQDLGLRSKGARRRLYLARNRGVLIGDPLGGARLILECLRALAHAVSTSGVAITFDGNPVATAATYNGSFTTAQHIVFTENAIKEFGSGWQRNLWLYNYAFSNAAMVAGSVVGRPRP